MAQVQRRFQVLVAQCIELLRVSFSSPIYVVVSIENT